MAKAALAEILAGLKQTSVRHQDCSYALFGLAHAAMLPALLARLDGLTGTLESRDELCEWECCFVPSPETPPGPLRNDDRLVRMRAGFDPAAGDLEEPSRNDMPWTAVVYGPPDATVTAAAVRHVLYRDVPLGTDPVDEMPSHGFALAWEFMRRGVSFLYKNAVWIRIYRVYELEHAHNLASAVPLSDPNPPPVNASAALRLSGAARPSSVSPNTAADGAATAAAEDDDDESFATDDSDNYDDSDSDMSSVRPSASPAVAAEMDTAEPTDVSPDVAPVGDAGEPESIHVVELVLTLPASAVSQDKKQPLQTMAQLAALFQGLVELRAVSHVNLRNNIRYCSFA